MSEFECDSHAQCYWTPGETDIAEGTCTSCSLCVSEHPGKEDMITCGCGVCGTTDDTTAVSLTQECLSFAEDSPTTD